MRAVIQRRYGTPDELTVGELPVPEPRPDEVLIAVRAASVHADVWHVVAGHPRFMRLMGNGVWRPKRPVPGTDVAGVVAAVGRDVTEFAVGDEVMAETLRSHQWVAGGAWAEFATAPERRTARKPDTISFAEAACVPTTGMIALDLVLTQGRLQPGEDVLVNGAGGALGTQVVQIARAKGARVTAVDSGAAKLELLERLGADRILDYRELDYTTESDRYDLVVDIPGNHPWSRVKRVLTPTGRYVLVGHDAYDATSHPWLGAMRTVLPLLVRAIASPHLSGITKAEPHPARMRELHRLVETGELSPVVGRTYALEDAPLALGDLMSGDTAGRLVLEP